MSGAFDGIRVLDLSHKLSGAYAARMFGDFGAEVLLIEPEEGHALRHEPPFVDDHPGADNSLLHAYANWNKSSIVAPAPDDLKKLIASADILVTNDLAPWTSEFVELLNHLSPHSVHLSITPHGLSGPLAELPGNNLTCCARSGWSTINRLQGEPPLQLPERQTGYIAGVAGFVAASAAWYRSVMTGEGEKIDLSEFDALASTSAPWAILGLFTQSPRLQYGPAGLRYRGVPGLLFDTEDGIMNYGFGEWGSWRKAMNIFGLPEIGADERYEPALGRHQQDLRPVVEALAVASRHQKKWELFHHLADIHCISGVVQNTQELLANDQLQAREFFVETQVVGKPARVTGSAGKLSQSPWRLERPAPAMRRHKSPGWGSARPDRKNTSQKAASMGPLAGVRVLTFTQAWSGTWGTELLSLLGADVVQIEGRKRPDVWRGAGAPVPRGVVNPEIEQSPLNTNGMFNSVNLNKKAITLDMTAEKGREIFWKLVPEFDVVAENFSPKVMAKWGITLDSLRKYRPDIIFASISGYGQDGPISMYPANGNTTEPMAGFSSVNGYVGDQGANTGGLIPDPISGYHFAAAILAAIVHRQQSGEGQRVDVSMVEAVAVQLGDAVLEYSANHHIRQPEGNHHPRVSPHNVYPTADDGWMAIAAETESQWRELASLMNIDESRFSNMSSRKQHELDLDQLISTYTMGCDAPELEKRLTGRGVNAARVRGFLDVYEEPDEHLSDRQYLYPVTHPESGTHYMPTLPWRLKNTKPVTLQPAPCFGQHSKAVFETELGMSSDEYEELEALGITGTTRL